MASVILLTLILFVICMGWLLLASRAVLWPPRPLPDNIIVVEDWAAALQRRASALKQTPDVRTSVIA